MLRGARRRRAQVHLAVLEALQQIVRGEVDHHHVVGVIEYMVGHGFTHADADDPTDQVIQAFQVLHVEGGPDIDAGAEQFFHVLPAFGVARAGRIAMGQFVHQHHGRTAAQGGVEVEFAERELAMLQRGARQLLQAMEQLGGFRAAVGFHYPGQHVAAQGGFALRRGEHGTGLAHPGVGAEVDPQFAAQGGLFFLLDPRQQGVGVGAFVV